MYLLGTGTWFVGLAIQFVLFPWLVALELQATPAQVGYAQTAILAPMLVLLLPAGVWADRHDPLAIIVRVQALAVIPPLCLAFAIWRGHLSYGLLIAFALTMGSLSALIAPAREGLLSQVAGDDIQHAVTVATGVQFGLQVIGFAIVALVSPAGAPVVLAIQAVVFACGAFAFRRLDRREFRKRRVRPRPAGTLVMVFEGLRAVFGSRQLTAVTVTNLSIGVLYMGVFMVGTPLLIREHYGGSEHDLAVANVCSTSGTIAATLLLYRFGGVRRPGRALFLALLGSSAALFAVGSGVPYPAFLALTVLSGCCGGIAMTMGRTLVQENAPDALRSRVMSIYTLSVLGGTPLGNLLMGHLADQVGVLGGITIAAIAMAATTLLVRLVTPLDEPIS